MASLYHTLTMHAWCLVFRVLFFVGHRSSFEWALNKAGKHSGWLMLEEDHHV